MNKLHFYILFLSLFVVELITGLHVDTNDNQIDKNGKYRAAYSQKSKIDGHSGGLSDMPGTSHWHKRWAILIAGSSGWYNYRHQADVCHAYKLLRQDGLEEENIVVMLYDDIANNEDNPFPGQIFNRPGGLDVYKGVKIDYRGHEVNASTFLAVLRGEKSMVHGVGTEKVIDSGPKDHVMVFFSDHGSAGILGMPSGPPLYGDQLLQTLRQKQEDNGFGEVAMYIEACESGSLFEGTLDPDLRVYITTAANATESSWGTYCPVFRGAPRPSVIADEQPEIDACLGDLYSVAWMEDSEIQDLRNETLKVQFRHVRARTSNNYTYFMGSHAMQYGDRSMGSDHVSDYIGDHGSEALVGKKEPSTASESLLTYINVPQREADLVPLRMRIARATDALVREQAQDELNKVLQMRSAANEAAIRATIRLLMLPDTVHLILENLRWASDAVFVESKYPGIMVPKPGYVEVLVSGVAGKRPEGSPVVDSWDCLREMVLAWTRVHGALDQYTMRHSRLFTNLCNSGINADGLSMALHASDMIHEQATEHVRARILVQL